MNAPTLIAAITAVHLVCFVILVAIRGIIGPSTDEAAVQITSMAVVAAAMTVVPVALASMAYARIRELGRSPLLMAALGTAVLALVPLTFAAWYVTAGTLVACVDGAAGPLDTLYFSYVTFTTLGYGEIVPLGPCRWIAALEAISGYVLLGLLIGAFGAELQRAD